MKAGDLAGGKYRIVRQLGEGGQGSVALAVDVRTEQFWAVKEIRAEGCAEADPEGRERMVPDPWHELLMMKSLRNRHIAAAVDVFQERGAVYLVTEYVRGRDLQRILKEEGPMTAEEVTEAGIQAAETLCYLEGHSPPVCHLDIKPSNLIRQNDGCIRLVDFGSAMRQDKEICGSGTDGYAAPEQYDPLAVKDVRTDIYGLGATMYRLLYGQVWKAEAGDSRLRTKPRGRDRMLAEVIERCVKERPEDRFQHAEDLRKALSAVRSGRLRRKRRRQVLAAGALALTELSAGAVLLKENYGASQVVQEKNYEELVREASCAAFQESLPLYREAVLMEPGRKEAYLAYLRGTEADGTCTEEEEGAFRELMYAVRPGSDQTGEEILALTPEAYGEVCTMAGLVIRYSYEGEDAARIASGWFQKAINAGEEAGLEEEESWFTTARMYQTLAVIRSGGTGSAEEGKEEWGGMDPADPSEKKEKAAEDAAQFLSAFGDWAEQVSRWEDPVLRMKAVREIAWELVFRKHDLEDGGVDGETVRGMMDDLLSRCGAGEEETAQEEILQSIESEVRDAAAALEES